MERVIGDKRYRAWCAARGLDLDAAVFHIETCYYGRTMRSRPGALVVTGHMVTHFSYRWLDTLWAIFEPSVRIDIPLAAIANFQRVDLGAMDRVKFVGTKVAFTITVATGEMHFLALHRNEEAFEAAMNRLLMSSSQRAG